MTDSHSLRSTNSMGTMVHIITGLNTGGAEMMLYKLLSRIDRTKFDPMVVSLTDDGPMADKIRSLGVSVHMLGLGRGIPNPLRLLRLARWLRKWKPEVVQTWMYHADLIGGLAARMARVRGVVWGVRQSTLEPATNSRRTILVARACARLSRIIPDRIVCCSEASKEVHVAIGYDAERIVVIKNGFDLDSFHADSEARKEVRAELGISEEDKLIGHVGRFDRVKDHRTIVAAAAEAIAEDANVHLALAGDGITSENHELTGWIADAKIENHVRLLGRRDDLPHVYAALDLFVSSSYAEGFPNVIGEAMATGVPCVVTDVGDSALIVGTTGFVVPPRDPVLLAEAIMTALGESPDKLQERGVAARNRIVDQFGLSEIVAGYEQLYREVMA